MEREETSLFVRFLGLIDDMAVSAEEGEQIPEQSFFDIGKFGVPVAVGGLIYMYLFSPLLLPGLSESQVQCGENKHCSAFLPAPFFLDTQSSFLVGLEVTDQSRAVGCTVDEAGLRGLDGLFLASVRYDPEA